MEIFLFGFIFLMSVVLHELAHGAVAYSLGDTTARDANRLSLNPLRHMDPFWTVLFPALLYVSTGGRFALGMAKPVPVDFSRLHHPKRDMILVALAGPLTNFGLAFVLSFLFRMSGSSVFLYATYFNLGLGVFNMMPIPPLDGSRVLTGLLPVALARAYTRLERFGIVIVVVLYFAGVLSYIIFPVIDLFCRGLGIPALRVLP